MADSRLAQLCATHLVGYQLMVRINAAARILYRAPRFSHITPLLYELHWLPVKYRIEYKIITLTFKAIHGTAPNYITELITFKTIIGIFLIN
jgi:hypothetical protein